MKNEEINVVKNEAIPNLLVYNVRGNIIDMVMENIISKHTENDLRVFILDNSVISYENYNDCLNLILPIKKSDTEIMSIINWLYEEIKCREKKFNDYKVNDISQYNNTSKDKMPKILLCINDVVNTIEFLAYQEEYSEFKNIISEIGIYGNRYGIQIILATRFNSEDANIKEISSFFEMIDEKDFESMIGNL